MTVRALKMLDRQIALAREEGRAKDLAKLEKRRAKVLLELDMRRMRR